MSAKPPSKNPAPSANGSLFGYFDGEKPWQLSETDLHYSREAVHWFRRISKAVDNRAYFYQQPLPSKSNILVELDGILYKLISSYDYLGLIGHATIERASIEAIKEFGTGTGGVRFFTGTNSLHLDLESALARFIGMEAAMTLSSGYSANLAAITSLLGKNSVVIVDEYIHRSVLDACKLAGARCAHFRHNDPEDLEKILSANPGEGKKLIIVEGVYSMHGDICPLEEIVRIKKEYGAHLMVDESHSLGVLGESGRGICEHAAVDTSCVDLITASLSKAFPANGGFVAGSRETIIFLQHQSATYMYSGALNPGSVSACRETLRVLGEEKWRVSKVKLNADRLRSGLKDLGYDTENSESPIIPIVTGAERPAVKLLQALYKRRVLASGALYPAVPRGCTRLRICASADQGDQYIDSLLEVFSECRKEL